MPFYKIDGTELLEAPTTVQGPDYQLYEHEHEKHSYPVEGWYWFAERETAVVTLGYVEQETEINKAQVI